MSWLLKGLLIGAAIAVAGVAIVGTGGLAAVAVVGAGAAMGAGLGEAMSTMSFAPKEVTGAIAMTGSSNVFVNNLAAARAHADMVACSKHPGPIPIATGSGQVFINGTPAARVDDKTGCSAVITKGSTNVYIGGGTVQTDTINPEDLVPGWVHASLLVVGIGSAIILAGPVVAAGGLVGAIAGGYGGGWLGGKVFGEGSDGQKWSAIAGSFLGGFLGAKGAPRAWESAWGKGPSTAPPAVPASAAKPALPPPKPADPVVPATGEPATVFRVQGGTPPRASRNIIAIDADGNPTIQSTTLNISIGDPVHAEYFQTLRPGSKVVSFKIPAWLDDFIQETAIPQSGYRSNPANQGGLAPKIVDPTTPGRSYELPAVWAKWLEENAIPGSGKVK
ncbi:PAAR domain-containing protein [Pseudoduganella chitinolytica]|uniref:PAAR domain-containing protein n=1 Tax=Pseudoduganella chitinolytica TaxID=34070 RepID=A0ABY8BG37_9BURK|nr:PAAR domain-containing protein [Pseudoduganella chitinolytica]WEF34263.1 PAAR domain-containing protein [Pseudoduganella chitinolytica]